MERIKGNFKHVAAVLLLTCISTSAMLVNSIVAKVALAFPTVSTENIKLVVTIPSITLIIFSMVGARLAYRVDQKKVVIIGMSCTLLGGVAPVFGGGFIWLIICRLFFGVGFGLCMALCSNLIIRLFAPDEQKRMFGLQAAMHAFFSLYYQVSGGLLGSKNWRYAFLGYLVIVPVLVFELLNCPHILPPVEKNDLPAECSAENGKEDVTFGVSTAAAIIFFFLLNMNVMSFQTDMAMAMAEKGIMSTLGSTLVFVFNGITYFLIGLYFNRIYKYCSKYMFSIGLFLLAVVFIGLRFANSLLTFALLGGLYGIAYGCYLPTYLVILADSAPNKVSSEYAMHLYGAINGASVICSPYYFKLASRITGQCSTSFDYLVAAVVCFAGAFLMIPYIRKNIKHTKTY